MASIRITVTMPSQYVVLMQAYYELSEGLATVRSFDEDKDSTQVHLYTEPSQLLDCLMMLHSIKETTKWFGFEFIQTESV